MDRFRLWLTNFYLHDEEQAVLLIRSLARCHRGVVAIEFHYLPCSTSLKMVNEESYINPRSLPKSFNESETVLAQSIKLN